ncbi:MAG: CBS domain-containing protein, partial [Phycisphaerae bacterium]
MSAAGDMLLGIVPGPGLLFGLMLVAAIVGGYAMRFVHLPRVIGFVLGGVVLRLMLDTAIDPSDDSSQARALEAAAEPLKAIKDLALGLILFTIGGVFERSKLRATRGRVLKIAACESGLVAALVFVGCAVVATLVLKGSTAGQAILLALFLGIAAIATAPAATLLVLREYEAKGPITDTILGVTGINNILCIVLFHSVFLILASFGVINATGALAEHLGLALALTTVGSVVLGVIAGTVIAILHAKLPLAETLLFFFAAFIILGAGEAWLWKHQGVSYNFLLTSLVTGAVFANVAIDSQRLDAVLRTVATPIFAGFFVMAGYGLHLSDLREMGLLGAVYFLCRFAGKVLGCLLGVRWAQAPERVGGRLGAALLCQAAVVIGLASFVERYWDSPLAPRFVTVILGSVIVFELVGPVLVKRCVVQGGEVKALTLLHRAGVMTGGTSIVRLTLGSLARLFGVSRRRKDRHPENMHVRHIMRTNVQFIQASATLDDVLHFIEGSTYNHFTVVQEDGEFVGVVHFSDVRDVMYDPALSALVTAVDLADPDSKVVPADMPLADLLDA